MTMQMFRDRLWKRVWPGTLPEVYSMNELHFARAHRVIDPKKIHVFEEMRAVLLAMNGLIVTSGSHETTALKLQEQPDLLSRVWRTSAYKKSADFWRTLTPVPTFVLDDDMEVVQAALEAGHRAWLVQTGQGIRS